MKQTTSHPCAQASTRIFAWQMLPTSVQRYDFIAPDFNVIEDALLDKVVQRIISNEMKFHQKRESAIQPSQPSKGIFSIEVDCKLISDHLRRVIVFTDGMKNGNDIFSDTELGFGEAVDKFGLLAEYYNFANFLDDPVYKSKSRTYFAALTENQIKALDPNIDPDALNLFVRDIENDIDPMEDHVLKNKLSNKRKLVWAVMLRHIRIANIVRYADTE
ncbi:MAG TPA: hypothetical protein VJZ68_08945, partial [Nitrososphaera sp.]|nr:hypothetical protein [Nitrososphaera sp.]